MPPTTVMPLIIAAESAGSRRGISPSRAPTAATCSRRPTSYELPVLHGRPGNALRARSRRVAGVRDHHTCESGRSGSAHPDRQHQWRPPRHARRTRSAIRSRIFPPMWRAASTGSIQRPSRPRADGTYGDSDRGAVPAAGRATRPDLALSKNFSRRASASSSARTRSMRSITRSGRDHTMPTCGNTEAATRACVVAGSRFGQITGTRRHVRARFSSVKLYWYNRTLVRHERHSRDAFLFDAPRHAYRARLVSRHHA